MESGHDNPNSKGILEHIFTTYQGLLAAFLLITAGVVFGDKIGEVLDLPSVSRQNAETIDSLGQVDVRILREISEVKRHQEGDRELLLDLVCSNPQTAVNRRECRGRG